MSTLETDIAALEAEIRSKHERLRQETHPERRLQLRNHIDSLEQALLAIQTEKLRKNRLR